MPVWAKFGRFWAQNPIFWAQGVKILVPSYRDSNETPFLCWKHWSVRLQLAASGKNVLENIARDNKNSTTTSKNIKKKPLQVRELLHSPSFACLHGRWSPSVHTFLIAGRREGEASPLQRFAEECGSETSQKHCNSKYKNIASVYKHSTTTLQENYRRMWWWIIANYYKPKTFQKW